MSDYKIIKVSRGEYQVLRPDGTDYFQFPVSKWKATQAIQDEQVHSRFLTNAGIKKAVQRYIMHHSISIGGIGNSLETFIYQYSYKLGHRDMRKMIKRPMLFIDHVDKNIASDKAARLASVALPVVDTYKYCNHHHELTPDYEVVNFGDGEFVANKAAVPLLNALNEAGLKTRTHHYTGNGESFVSILLDGVRVEIKTVNEVDADRTQFNGKTELLISWDASVGI
ncbi:hypothetical protein SNE25_21125 [Mucilaginibacter sabulilitoris]|uniref:Uncharacterized protein n=1 Tax=Mucilaginibacter sabulilitoris TaxID=1173583 RepID=A0ABZ0TI20_9SPHI|nr:hypothetical protein [Mucilaginibacter sabulilitoris]WPU91823.1 hypothetical protein SNE25_21125 [Mucilaginibacter sabulilitoris]